MGDEDEFEVTVVDVAKDGMLMPPADDVCQQCAVDHDPHIPHNQQSLYFQMWHYRQRGWWPTWGDAMAHCDDDMKDEWKRQLMSLGVTEDQLLPGPPSSPRT